MGFNYLVNFSIMFHGILEFFGMVGGISFLVWFVVHLLKNRPLTEEEKVHQCESCQIYETCAAVMLDCLPDYPCAYYEEKKKP